MKYVRTSNGSETATQAFEELTRMLWHQRRLLETLLFKLDVERLLLDAGDLRWLPVAAVEVGIVLDRVADEDLVLDGNRLSAVHEALGLSRSATLAQVIAAAPSPWDHILTDHRVALTEVLAETAALAADNAARVHPAEVRWAESGVESASARGEGRLIGTDEELTRRARERALEAAVAVTARVALPGLRRFLH